MSQHETGNDLFNSPNYEISESNYPHYSKFYMGWIHSLKIAGFFNNLMPLWPETIIDKYEGYFFDQRGKSRELLTVRGETNLFCFKNGVRFIVQDIEDIERIMKLAYKGQILIYQNENVPVP